MIQLNNVSVSLGTFTLKNIQFTLPKGYTIGCIGRNGAGKSTLIRTMMGVYVPNEGEVLWHGQPLSKEAKERIGFVYDDLYVSKEMKVKAFRSLMRVAYPTWSDERFTSLLQQFQLDEKKKMKALSKGMKMKLHIALALSHDVDVLIMDEPTAGLDPVFRRQFIDVLRDWMDEKEGRTLFFSTHITSDLEQFADYILLIDDGAISFFLPIDELDEKYALAKGPVELLARYESSFEAVEIRHGQFTALVDRTKHSVVAPLIEQRASLEDILYFLTEVDR